MHKQVDHLLAVLHPARVNLFSQHVFRVGIVQPVVEFEIRILPRLVNRPARKTARHFRDVLLHVTAVHTEGVQLHQFAPVILIQSAFIFLRLLRVCRWTWRPAKSSAAPLLAHGPLGGLPLRGSWIRAQKIVQIKKHRWALGRRGQQVLEFSQCVRLDDVAFIRRKVVAVFAFGRENVEVVEPEIVHHLLELPLAVNRARHLGHTQFRHHALRPFAVVGNRARNVVGIATTQNVAPAGAICRRLQRRLLFHRSRRVGIVWPGLRRGNGSGGRRF